METFPLEVFDLRGRLTARVPANGPGSWTLRAGAELAAMASTSFARRESAGLWSCFADSSHSWYDNLEHGECPFALPHGSPDLDLVPDVPFIPSKG